MQKGGLFYLYIYIKYSIICSCSLTILPMIATRLLVRRTVDKTFVFLD